MRWILVVLGAILSGGVSAAQESAPNVRALFVDLTLTKDGVTYVGRRASHPSSPVPVFRGICRSNPMYWELQDAKGRVLWCGPVRDTRFLYLDREDPATGTIVGGEMKVLDTAPLTLIVPDLPQARTLVVCRRIASFDGKGRQELLRTKL